MAEDTIYTDGVIPTEDLRERESWLSGQPSYKPGEVEMEVLGYQPAPAGKKGVVIIHKIVEGDPENKGRKMQRYFDFGTKNKDALNFLKGYCEKIGGKEAFTNEGKPNVRALVGARFRTVIYARQYKDPKTGQDRTGYDFDMQTAVVTRRANGAGGAAPGFSPAR